MNRIELINTIFKETNFKNYLEIGCQTGASFLPINAKRKTAVDPLFIIPLKRRIKWLLLVPNNVKNKFFEETSDDFFEHRKNYLTSIKPLDVALIDGLHTFKAALLDVINTLNYLNSKGIIVMHDCFPPHKAAALPTQNVPTPDERKNVEGWTGEWCGDVWKAIVYLRKCHSNVVDVCVLNTDFGLGIVRPISNASIQNITINEKVFNEINALNYDDLMKDANNFLNLKPVTYAQEIVNELVTKNK